MIQRATDVGELVSRMLARGGHGRVTRVFPTSAYIRVRDDFVVVLWGRLRSPLTVNVDAEGTSGEGSFELGAECELRHGGISVGDSYLGVSNAAVFRSSLRGRAEVNLPGLPSLVNGITMLKSLYEVAQDGPKLVEDPALRYFAGKVLTPLSKGKSRSAYGLSNYSSLIGRGGGFTPAGDDFVGGFLATFNFVARQRRVREVSLPVRRLISLTVPESAVILGHAAQGYVDEAVEKLVLAAVAGASPSFHRELLSVARRGHTSGIDMSLGVLLCAAALSEQAGARGVLASCMDAIWNP